MFIQLKPLKSNNLRSVHPDIQLPFLAQYFRSDAIDFPPPPPTMPGMATSEVHVGVGIVVSPDRRKVLVCLRRADDYWGGWWEFPGGKCEGDESPADCIVRELQEEVGIVVRPMHPLTVVRHHYADRDRLVNLHSYLCELIEGTPTPIEVAQCAWLTPAELRGIRFLPANAPIISELEAHLRGK